MGTELNGSLGGHRSIVGASRIFVRFQILCFVLERGRFKDHISAKRRTFRPYVKIRVGLGELSKSKQGQSLTFQVDVLDFGCVDVLLNFENRSVPKETEVEY